METIKACIVIPSYEPNDKLLSLLGSLRSYLSKPEYTMLKAEIILVDDGSGPEYAHIFKQAEDNCNCVLLRHAVNLGKGRALKTAFNHFLNEYPDYPGVVTADSDGQHAVEDIVRCITELSGTNSLICGCRDFDSKDVPFKSRYGNKLTRNVFRFLSGVKLSDTQTGLRAIPAGMLGTMLSMQGERFEYEMNMLIECGTRGIKIKEVPIQTIYLENNKGTHFNPLFDSLKIYATFLKYLTSSLGGACLDFFIFWVLTSMDMNIAAAMVFSRAGSMAFNFTINRNIVFKARSNVLIQALKYVLLAAVSGTASYFMLTFMSRAIPLLVSKAIAESLLFFVNFYLQRTKVFNRDS